MTVAVVKNSAGDKFVIHNKIKNSAGVLFTVSDDMKDSDGNPFTVFGATIATTISVPMIEYFATAKRIFPA